MQKEDVINPESTRIFNLTQCLTLEKIALELDVIYRQAKTLANAASVESAYIKACKCFLEEYEKNNKEALIHLIKMWHLLAEIEFEKKTQDPSYSMPEEVKKLADAVRKILPSTSPRPRSNSGAIASHSSSPRSHTQLIQRFDQLRVSMEKLDNTQESPRTEPAGSIMARLNYRLGRLFYTQAKKIMTITKEKKTNSINMEELFANAEALFVEALKFFIAAYHEKTFGVFSEIRRTFTTISDLEQIRKTIEEDNYAVHKELKMLESSLRQITEKEKKRQLEKESSENFEETADLIQEAKNLIDRARIMKHVLKNDHEQNYATVEGVYLEATKLFLLAHEQKKQDALVQAEETLDECLQFCSSRNAGSKVLVLSPEVSKTFEVIKHYKEKIK